MTMSMKRYEATDMRTALKQVRREQGPDAVIVSTRNVAGGVEVCATSDMVEARAVLAAARARAMPPLPMPPPVAATPDSSAVGAELKSLRRLLEQQLATLTWNDWSRREPSQQRLLEELDWLGVARDTALRLLPRLVAAAGEGWSYTDLATWMAQQLPVTGLPGVAAGALAVVGASGVGKSTTLAKLAAREVLQHGAAGLALVCADVQRLGAAEQTRALGRVLGVNTHTVNDADELAALAPILKRKRLVLIDTGGVAARDSAAQLQLERLLDTLPGTRPVLVLAASAQDTVLRAGIVQWRNRANLTAVLTRIDEAAHPGTAVAELIAAGIPLAALSNGPRIPEDLQAASSAALLDYLLTAAHSSQDTYVGDAQHAA